MHAPDPPPGPLRTQRAILALGGALIPAFGVAFAHVSPAAVDPMGRRVALAGLIFAVLAGTYASAWVRARLDVFVRVLAALVAVWYVALTAANAADPVYAFGLLFTLPALSVVFSIGLRRGRWQVLFDGATLAYLLVLYPRAPGAAAAPVPPVMIAAFVGLLVGVMGLVLWQGRLANDRLDRSRRRLAAVVHAATDAFLLVEGPRWTVRDANPSAHVLVAGAGPVEGAPLGALFREGAAALERLCATALAEGAATDGPLRLGPDGPVVDVAAHRLDGLHERGDGRPASVSLVLHDVTAREAYAAELELARAEAEQMEAFKTSMLANVRHEVRTPVSIVLGAASVLRDEVPEAHREMVGYIEEAGGRLARLLNVLLELAELDAGTRRLEAAPVDVARLVREVAEGVRPAADAKGLGLAVRTPPGAVVVTLDAAGLRQIAGHLLENAVKFTHRGHVALALQPYPDRLVLTVEDTGIGLPEAFRAHLFAPFRQASTGLARAYEGSGLGLHLTERLVRALGGTITCEAVAERGTRFHVAFPCGGGDGAAGRDAPVVLSGRPAPAPHAPSPRSEVRL